MRKELKEGNSILDGPNLDSIHRSFNRHVNHSIFAVGFLYEGKFSGDKQRIKVQIQGLKRPLGQETEWIVYALDDEIQPGHERPRWFVMLYDPVKRKGHISYYDKPWY